MQLAAKPSGVRVGQAFPRGNDVYVLTSEKRARWIASCANKSFAKTCALAYNVMRIGQAVPKARRRPHYEIMNPLVPEAPIDCTETPSDARAEEPDARLIEVAKKRCRSCHGQ